LRVISKPFLFVREIDVPERVNHVTTEKRVTKA
jgi:hypothetical protein